MISNLGILTENGQKTLVDEQRAVEIFTHNYKDLNIILTDKDKPSFIDGIILRNQNIIGIVETKCRYDVTEDEFFGRYLGEWLVTFKKIEHMKTVSSYLCCDGWGFLYLKRSDVLLIQKIVEYINFNNADYCEKIRIDNTETREHINGGKIYRVNAYIDMKNSERLRI